MGITLFACLSGSKNIIGDNYEKLGKNFGNYLVYDKSRGWTVKHLNFFQQFFRNWFGFYGETHFKVLDKNLRKMPTEEASKLADLTGKISCFANYRLLWSLSAEVTAMGADLKDLKKLEMKEKCSKLLAEVTAKTAEIKEKWAEDQLKTNEEVKDYSTDAELQAALIKTTKEYAKVYHALRDSIKKEKENFSSVDKSEIAKAFEPVDQALNALLKEVEAIARVKRSQVLYHNNNRDLAGATGANNTYYYTDEDGSTHCLVVYRSVPAGRDGIGALGGLANITLQFLPNLDLSKFNSGDENTRKYLNNVIESKKDKEAELDQHIGKTAAKLLEYMDKKNDPKLKHEIAETFLDDVDFDAEGNMLLDTDPNKVAMKAMDREQTEEADELHNDLTKALRELAKKNPSPFDKKLQIGCNKNVVDDNYLLTINGISAPEGVGRAVSPVVCATKCNKEDFIKFEEALNANKGTKITSSISHGEIAGCTVANIADLRRCGGVVVNKDGSELLISSLIQSQRAVYGSYAYRYPHELMGLIKISIINAIKDIEKENKRIKAAVKMAKTDQWNIFEVDVKKYNLPVAHKLSLLASAKAMFNKDLEAEKRKTNVTADELDEKMYQMLSEELTKGGSCHISVDMLKAMDEAAAEVWNKRMKQ